MADPQKTEAPDPRPASRVLVQGLPFLFGGANNFLARSEVRAKPVSTLEELLRAMKEQHPPLAVVANLLCSDAEIRKIKAAIEAPSAAPPPRLILVSRKPASARIIGRARMIPGAVCITGDERIRARVFELLAELLGVEPRHHLRSQGQRFSVTLQQQGGQPEKGEVLNVSRSGAKLSGPWRLALGERCQISLELPDGPLGCAVTVERFAGLLPGAPAAYGVRFADLRLEDANRLGQLLEGGLAESARRAEQPRSQARRPVPKRLKVLARVRKVSSKAVCYLRAVDLSAGGFSASTGYVPPLAVGEPVQVLIYCGHLKMEGQAEVVRCQPQGEGHVVAFRFHALGPEDSIALQRLLLELQARDVPPAPGAWGARPAQKGMRP